MKPIASRRPRIEVTLILLMLAQTLCLAFFVFDIADDISDMLGAGVFEIHVAFELLANFGLVAAVIVEAVFLRRLLRESQHAQRALSVASGALNDLMQDYFTRWGLTPSEADVATFTIKGFSIAEIAKMREAAEGTVKSQLNAIYRKSGLAGRGQLVSVLIEDLMSGPLQNRNSVDDTDAA